MPLQPRCCLAYPRLVVGVESQIGSVTRNMKPVAKKAQKSRPYHAGLAVGAVARIDRHLTARNPRTRQRPS
jgi:hypothetical protein